MHINRSKHEAAKHEAARHEVTRHEATSHEAATSLDARIREEQARLLELSKSLAAAARALGPLARSGSYANLGALRTALDRVAPHVESVAEREKPLARLLDEIRAWLNGSGDRLRQKLGRELKEKAADSGITMAVLSREPSIELRLPPVLVVVDPETAEAEIRFARLPLARCPADAQAILATRERVVRGLEADFEPREFFDKCYRAWRAARAAANGNERVEILDFLPYLALEMQGRRFREEPRREHFKDYGRARFAYNVLQLRRARMLNADGWRLNLGVATGTSASQKKRVIYFEDESGDGEYKLTLFFTREVAEDA